MACREPLATDNIEFNIPTQYMTADILRASGIFGKNASWVDVPVNRLLEPKLYTIYNREATQ
jgi:hypothetical protein